MRIVYGIHGYGQGHATRAWAVLPDLLRRHDVRIFAGRDANEALRGSFDVTPIPSLGFVYRGSRVSKRDTFFHNAPHILDLITVGKTTRQMLTELRDFAPDVVVCDCEPWTFRAAGILSIPRIAFDHFGIMVRCKVPLPLRNWLASIVNRTIYKLLVGPAERSLVSSFYPAPPCSRDVRLIGTLLRSQVRALAPSLRSHVLAYFNKGADQLTPEVFQALHDSGAEILLYGANREGSSGNIHFRPRSNEAFLQDLASCYAVISTAGNQLVGEALQFGKPFLAIPESSVEQHMNAAAIAKLCVGEWVEPEQLTSDRIRAFLERAPEYAQNAGQLARDGKAEAVETLETWFSELTRRRGYKNRLREAIA